MVLNSLSFCLSVKLLISPSYLNEILAEYSNLVCRLFSSITVSMFCYSLLAWRVSIEISAVILMGIPLCVICCFSLATFNICSLSLTFVNLIICVLECLTFGLSCLGLWVSCSTGNCPRQALGCMHLRGLSHSASGTRVVLRGSDSIGPAFCVLPSSEQLR